MSRKTRIWYLFWELEAQKVSIRHGFDIYKEHEAFTWKDMLIMMKAVTKIKLVKVNVDLIIQWWSLFQHSPVPIIFHAQCYQMRMGSMWMMGNASHSVAMVTNASVLPVNKSKMLASSSDKWTNEVITMTMWQQSEPKWIHLKMPQSIWAKV